MLVLCTSKIIFISVYIFTVIANFPHSLANFELLKEIVKIKELKISGKFSTLNRRSKGFPCCLTKEHLEVQSKLKRFVKNLMHLSVFCALFVGLNPSRILENKISRTVFKSYWKLTNTKTGMENQIDVWAHLKPKAAHSFGQHNIWIPWKQLFWDKIYSNWQKEVYED